MLTIGLYRDLSDWAGKLTGKTAQSGAGWIAVKAKGGLSDSGSESVLSKHGRRVKPVA